MDDKEFQAYMSALSDKQTESLTKAIGALKLAEPSDDAEMAEKGGAMEKLSQWEIMNVPVGQALVGGFTAVMVTEVTDGFLAKQSKMVSGIVKLIEAGLLGGFGKQVIGKTGSSAAALLVGFDGLRDIVPFDMLAKQVAVWLTGVLPTAGLAQGARGRNGATVQPITTLPTRGGQVNIAGSYYRRAGI